MPVQDRIRRYKTTGGGAGLVRVEVLVPAGDRDAILARAADLRARHRAQDRSPPPNREAVNDRAKLILHRLIAGHMRRDPSIVARAGAALAAMADPQSSDARAWDELLRLNINALAWALVSRSGPMTRLRSVSPLRLPPGHDDPAWRRRLWRKAALGLPR